MKTVWNIFLAILIIAAAAGALFFRQGSRNPLCEPALYLGQPGNRPEEIIEEVIEEVGGLPQKDANLSEIDDPRIIIPVEEWRIRSAVVQNVDDNFAASLRDDDAAMSYAIDLDVSWEDGATGVVQWTSWRYGWVSCPIAMSKGSGPLGSIRIVELTPAPPAPEETPDAESGG